MKITLKEFRSQIQEDLEDPAEIVGGSPSINNRKLYEFLQGELRKVSSLPYATPHIGLERVRKCIAPYNLQLPHYAFESIESGEMTFKIFQFGEMVDNLYRSNPGSVELPECTLHFKYMCAPNGEYMINATIDRGNYGDGDGSSNYAYDRASIRS